MLVAATIVAQVNEYSKLLKNIWVLTNWLSWKKLNGFVFFQSGCVFYKTALMKKFYFIEKI